MKNTTDVDIDSQLNADGFKLINHKLSLSHIDDLTEIFHKYHKVKQSGFFTSFSIGSTEVKKKIDHEIKNITKDLLKKIFPGYEILSSNYVVKSIGEESFLSLHRDWSVVDEMKCKSISVWIPLVNIDDTNGMLGFVNGSHKDALPYRGPSYKESLFHESNKDDSSVKYVPMKKGEILTFLPGTLHTSKSNISNQVRLAITLVLIPNNSKASHFYFPKGNYDKIIAYTVKEDFFLKYKLGDIPKGKISFIIKSEKRVNYPFTLFYC